jgi:hypothetical protein
MALSIQYSLPEKFFVSGSLKPDLCYPLQLLQNALFESYTRIRIPVPQEGAFRFWSLAWLEKGTRQIIASWISTASTPMSVIAGLEAKSEAM